MCKQKIKIILYMEKHNCSQSDNINEIKSDIKKIKKDLYTGNGDESFYLKLSKTQMAITSLVDTFKEYKEDQIYVKESLQEVLLWVSKENGKKEGKAEGNESKKFNWQKAAVIAAVCLGILSLIIDFI